MKKNVLNLIIITTLFISSCGRGQNSIRTEKPIEKREVTDCQKDQEAILNLMHQVLRWSESRETIDILPVLTDSKDSIYIGFDMKKLSENLERLREINFFSNEFIDNYKRIILTLDWKLKNKEFVEWFVGDQPPFKFTNDLNPWCLCQGYSPEQFNHMEIIQIDNRSAELSWKWKKETDWKDFNFRVVKVGKKWKISYLEGFDYKESIKKEGEI